MNGTKKMLI